MLAVLPALALASCSDSESGDAGAQAGSGTQTERAAAVQAETTSSTATTAADPPRLARSRGDGSLFVLTSNRDGRGSPRSSDDRILRVVPPAG